jgi:adenylyltransferase/sulfurtransferase
MTVRILIPTVLRPYTNGAGAAEVKAKTVGDALDQLTLRFPNLVKYLFNDKKALRNFVNVYVNDEDIRNAGGTRTPLKDGDRLMIVPSVAGGVAQTRERRFQLSNEEILRYGRHLIMPEVGLEGQIKLKKASVLIVGAGGLGTPAAIYLAAAGVGRLGIVDFDTVEASNLHRQILYSREDIGKSKLEVAKSRLLQVNPNVEVEIHATRLDSSNALDLMKNYDIIMDGTDNFPTRYLVNDACVLLGKPNVYASIFRFEGQASIFYAKEGPCYRCLYPEPPPPGLVPSCAEGGVLGVLPGIMGSIQAVEALKLILGKGDSLIGRLLVFDSLSMEFIELKLKKNPECVLCGPNPSVTKLIDYEDFCGLTREEKLGEEFEVPVATLKSWIDSGKDVKILDVREPHEYEICHMEGSKLIPLGQLPEKVNELDTADLTVVHCHTGVRSAAAVRFLQSIGFKKVKNLRGGIDAWAREIEPDMPRY